MNFCPAHVTRTVRLADGSTRSVLEPCPPDAPRARAGVMAATSANDEPMGALPEYAGNLRTDKVLAWSGKCFRASTASLQVDAQGYTMVFELGGAASLTCAEEVLLPTTNRFNFHYFFAHGHHEVRVNGFGDADEKAELLASGLPLFFFPDSMLTTLMDAYEIYKTFVAVNNKSVDELIKFHKEFFGYTYKARNPVLLDIPDSALQTGDVFGLHQINADYTFQWLSTGGHIGHVAICVFIEGVPYVFETTDATFLGGPPYGFHMTPFQQWKKIYASNDYEIAWFRLRKDLAARISTTDVRRAYKWFLDHQMPFDVPSIIFVALDTAHDNLPPPFTSESIFMMASIVEKVNKMKTAVDYRLLQAINMRFVKYYAAQPCPDLICAHQRAFDLNTTLPDVAALPEVDGWVYSTGESIVCAGLVANMLRELGVLGGITFTAGEQGPKDISQLAIYEQDWQDRPLACWGSTGLPTETPYCQIAGRWALEIQEYNTVSPYTGMNNHCGSMPPDYHRFPDDC